MSKTETDRQTDRDRGQTDRQADRQTDRDRDRQTDRQKGRQAETEIIDRFCIALFSAIEQTHCALVVRGSK